MFSLYMKKPCARLILFLSLLFVMTQVAYSQTVSINNVSSNIGSGRYKWTAYIEGDKSVLSKINYVEYHLPDVYGDKAVRKVSAPRAGKYPFSLTDSAFEPFSIGVMIFFKDSNPLKLPDYTLVFSGSINNPGGVAITPLAKVKQRNSIDISAPDFQGAISVYVGDIHDAFKKEPFYIKISRAGSSELIKETRLSSGPSITLPFNYDGREYILTGYTKTSIFDDYLYFKIYRKSQK
jgi:hypothetical protein